MLKKNKNKKKKKRWGNVYKLYMKETVFLRMSKYVVCLTHAYSQHKLSNQLRMTAKVLFRKFLFTFLIFVGSSNFEGTLLNQKNGGIKHTFIMNAPLVNQTEFVNVVKCVF